MEMCSLKVLELEGSPSHMLLRLMGERGCTAGHLMDYLQTLGNTEAVQCLKPAGTVWTQLLRSVLFGGRRVQWTCVSSHCLFQCTALQILIQPQSVAVVSGHNLRLSCHAVGKSPVQYQWFKSREEVRVILFMCLDRDQIFPHLYAFEIHTCSLQMWTAAWTPPLPAAYCDWHFLHHQVPSGVSPDLVISPIHLKDAGFYICRVNCGDAVEFSQWAQVDVLNVGTPGDTPGWISNFYPNKTPL